MYLYLMHPKQLGKRFVRGEKEEELELDQLLRPTRFDDFKGQQQTCENLQVYVRAASQREGALDHVLLHGPPGLGKTTLAHIIAHALGVGIKMTTGPIMDKPANLAGVLTKLKMRDVLFIDEIHRLNPVVEEYLYGAMEDYHIDVLLDSGVNARSLQIHLEPFTLIGATTRAGLLTAPLRDRFGIKERLNYYDTSTLYEITMENAKKLAVPVHSEAAEELARRSRGTPRIANHLLKRLRDFAEVKSKGTITKDVCKAGLEALHIDEEGLDEMDNRLLSVLIDKFNGGPVGIKTLSTACEEEAHTIEEVYEPFLIQKGYLRRTPRGREAMPSAYVHLKRAPGGQGRQGKGHLPLFDDKG